MKLNILIGACLLAGFSGAAEAQENRKIGVTIAYGDCREKIERLEETLSANKEFETNIGRSERGRIFTIQGGYMAVSVECLMTGQAEIRSVGFTGGLPVAFAENLGKVLPPAYKNDGDVTEADLEFMESFDNRRK